MDYTEEILKGDTAEAAFYACLPGGGEKKVCCGVFAKGDRFIAFDFRRPISDIAKAIRTFKSANKGLEWLQKSTIKPVFRVHRVKNVKGKLNEIYSVSADNQEEAVQLLKNKVANNESIENYLISSFFDYGSMVDISTDEDFEIYSF